MTTQTNISKRWGILAVGVFAMLFAGILYAWSILKTPFAAELGYDTSVLALCFTLAMCFFCLGGEFFIKIGITRDEGDVHHRTAVLSYGSDVVVLRIEVIIKQSRLFRVHLLHHLKAAE